MALNGDSPSPWIKVTELFKRHFLGTFQESNSSSSDDSDILIDLLHSYPLLIDLGLKEGKKKEESESWIQDHPASSLIQALINRFEGRFQDQLKSNSNLEDHLIRLIVTWIDCFWIDFESHFDCCTHRLIELVEAIHDQEDQNQEVDDSSSSDLESRFRDHQRDLLHDQQSNNQELICSSRLDLLFNLISFKSRSRCVTIDSRIAITQEREREDDDQEDQEMLIVTPEGLFFNRHVWTIQEEKKKEEKEEERKKMIKMRKRDRVTCVQVQPGPLTANHNSSSSSSPIKTSSIRDMKNHIERYFSDSSQDSSLILSLTFDPAGYERSVHKVTSRSICSSLNQDPVPVPSLGLTLDFSDDDQEEDQIPESNVDEEEEEVFSSGDVIDGTCIMTHHHSNIVFPPNSVYHSKRSSLSTSSLQSSSVDCDNQLMNTNHVDSKRSSVVTCSSTCSDLFTNSNSSNSINNHVVSNSKQPPMMIHAPIRRDQIKWSSVTIPASNNEASSNLKFGAKPAAHPGDSSSSSHSTLAPKPNLDPALMVKLEQVQVLRVFNACDGTCRLVTISCETSAREVIMVLLRDYFVAQSRKRQLSSVGAKSSDSNNVPDPSPSGHRNRSASLKHHVTSALKNLSLRTSSNSSERRPSAVVNPSLGAGLSSLDFALYELTVSRIPNSEFAPTPSTNGISHLESSSSNPNTSAAGNQPPNGSSSSASVVVKSRRIGENNCDLFNRPSSDSSLSRILLKQVSGSDSSSSNNGSGSQINSFESKIRDGLVNEYLKQQQQQSVSFVSPLSNSSPAPPMSTISITDLDPLVLALHLTARAYDLFARVDPQALLCHVLIKQKEKNQDRGDKKDENQDKKKIIGRFESLTEHEMFWAMNVLLSESAVSSTRGVKAAKILIQVAAICRDKLRNYGTCAAIQSALGHGSISRLKRTLWDQLDRSSKKTWERINSSADSILDVSRNMGNYRRRVSGAPRPLVPFYPIHKKDFTFLDISGGNTFKVIQEEDSQGHDPDEHLSAIDSQIQVNWIKIRDLCRSIRSFLALSQSSSASSFGARSLNYPFETIGSEYRHPLIAAQSSSSSSSNKPVSIGSVLKPESEIGRKLFDFWNCEKRTNCFLDHWLGAQSSDSDSSDSGANLLLNEELLFAKSLEIEPPQPVIEPPPAQPAAKQEDRRRDSVVSDQGPPTTSVVDGANRNSANKIGGGGSWPGLGANPAPSSSSSAAVAPAPLRATSSHPRFGVTSSDQLNKLLALTTSGANQIKPRHHRARSGSGSSSSNNAMANSGAKNNGSMMSHAQVASSSVIPVSVSIVRSTASLIKPPPPPLAPPPTHMNAPTLLPFHLYHESSSASSAKLDPESSSRSSAVPSSAAAALSSAGQQSRRHNHGHGHHHHSRSHTHHYIDSSSSSHPGGNSSNYNVQPVNYLLNDSPILLTSARSGSRSRLMSHAQVDSSHSSNIYVGGGSHAHSHSHHHSKSRERRSHLDSNSSCSSLDRQVKRMSSSKSKERQDGSRMTHHHHGHKHSSSSSHHHSHSSSHSRERRDKHVTRSRENLV